jgi:poly(A) RNA polymerase
MEVIGDLMHVFLPAINNVRKILNARVPIIKYNHECLDLDIDFSMSNMTGFYMSELLYLYGEIDERVRPLVFCLRKWASLVGLTNSATPGRWITNFSLTVMVLFFLQNIKKPILPSMSLLIKSATPNDIRVTDDNINCTFLRDLNKLSFKTENIESLHHLLLQFYEFYSTFNFQQNGISLIEGRPITKPDHSAIWITNPLEPLLNVSKNVSHEELEKLKLETRNAAWILESTIDKNKDPSSWGLMSLFRSKKRVVKPEMFFKSRLVDVTDLFKDDSIKDYDNISYKNAAVKSAVKQIQKSTQREISKLMKNS